MSYNHIIHSCVLDSSNIFLGILSKPSLSQLQIFFKGCLCNHVEGQKTKEKQPFCRIKTILRELNSFFLWNNNLFCFIELIYPLVTWVKTIHRRNHLIYILYHAHLFLKVMIVIAYFVMLVLILISMDFPPNVSDIVNNNHYNNLSSYHIIKTSHGNQVTVIDCLDVLHFNSSTLAFFLTEKNCICQGYSVAILILL